MLLPTVFRPLVILSPALLILPYPCYAQNDELYDLDPEADARDDFMGSNVGPLTTTFTPAPSCFNTRMAGEIFPLFMVGCEGTRLSEEDETAPEDDCCPYDFAMFRYYSPGVCPSGYSACPLPSTRQRAETTRMCCPNDFACPTGVNWELCSSVPKTPVTTRYTDSPVPTMRQETIVAVFASPIQIRFRSSDSESVPLPTDSAGLDLPPPYDDDDEEDDEDDRDGGGLSLSLGERMGIGFGVVFAVILLTSVCCGCCCKKSKEKESDSYVGPVLQETEMARQTAEAGADPAMPRPPSRSYTAPPSRPPSVSDDPPPPYSPRE